MGEGGGEALFSFLFHQNKNFTLLIYCNLSFNLLVLVLDVYFFGNIMTTFLNLENGYT